MPIEFRGERLRAALRTAKSRIGPEVEQALESHAKWFGAYFARNGFLSQDGNRAGTPGDPTRTRLFRRTGGLANSQAFSLARRGLNSRLNLSIGSSPKVTDGRARLHEYGGTITPRRARFLTIPLSDNFSAGGRIRYETAGDAIDRANAFFLTRGSNTFIVFDKASPGQKPNLQFLFILKKRVVVPARLGFRRAVRSEVVTADRQSRLSEAAKQALNEAFGGNVVRSRTI